MMRATICAVVLAAMLVPAQMHRADAQTGQTYEGGVMRTFVDAIYVQGDGNIIRRGNWTGPGWWGGSEDPNKAGNLPPIDSMDAVAMRHDFGYQIAEEYGKRFNCGRLEQRLKAMADEIAVRDALALPDNPMDWPMPPPAAAPGSTRNHLADARASRAQIINGFSKLAIARRAGGFASGVGRGAYEYCSAFVSGFTLSLLPTWGPAMDRAELTRVMRQLPDGFFSPENLDKQIQAKIERWYRENGYPEEQVPPMFGAVRTPSGGYHVPPVEGQRCRTCGGSGMVPRTDDSREARDGIFGDMMKCPACDGTGLEAEAPTEEQIRAAYNDGFQWGREVARGMLSTAAIRAGTQERMGKYKHDTLRKAFREGYARGAQ